MTHSGRRRNIGTFIATATIAFFFALAAVLRFIGAERTNITRWTLLVFLLGIRRRRPGVLGSPPLLGSCSRASLLPIHRASSRLVDRRINTVLVATYPIPSFVLAPVSILTLYLGTADWVVAIVRYGSGRDIDRG